MIAITCSDITIEIDESDGGRATSWRVSEHELLGSAGRHPIDYGMYPMAPWAGRVSGNAIEWSDRVHSLVPNFGPWAIHGLALTGAFEVIERHAHRAVLGFEFPESRPFDGGIRCTWSLDAGGLTTEISCYALDASFPAVVGWHPWFRREIAGALAAWSSDCEELLVRGADSLPTGERTSLRLDDGPFDDVIAGGRNASIEWPEFLRIEIENSHPWFVVYDATESFVCIEPQSGPADGISGRLAPIAVVTPGQPLVMSTRWNLRRGPLAAGA